MTARATPRYSSRPLPTAAFVPGVSKRADRPAPPPERPTAVDLDALAENDDFRHGVDLLNHGFPWEAHEAWEPLWFAAPRDRPERALLQGLIHAAAAVVKARAGAHDAARGLVASACEHLARATPAVLDVPDFAAALTAWADDPARPAPAIVLAAATVHVFVYGTLLAGEANHALLAPARLVSRGRTRPAFWLYDLGAFPALVPGGPHAIVGEVYAVDAPTLTALDRLEDHPEYYRRTRIVLDDGTPAETYLLTLAQVAGHPVIASGSWRARAAGSR